MRHLLPFATALALAAPVLAQDRAGDTNRILDEGMNHSEVMPIAQHLTDVIGPRLTNSPQMREAEK